MCVNCFAKLKFCYAFLKQCQNSQEVIHNIAISVNIDGFAEENSKDNKSVDDTEDLKNDSVIREYPEIVDKDVSVDLAKQFNCRYCGNAFQTKFSRDIHEKIHKNLDSATCKICFKIFSRPYDVKRHMTVHTGDKPYNCKICDKKFTQIGTLTSHLKKHEEESGEDMR